MSQPPDTPEAPEATQPAESTAATRLEAHVSGGGSAYLAGGNQVFVYEDGTRSVWRTGPGAADALCPYPGLIAFGLEQAQWFFGRDDATAQLVAEAAERLQRGGPLMVIGPSGSGKSSLLRAGLVPAIAGGRLPDAGSARWPLAVFTPTAHPLAELSGRLARLAATPGHAARRVVLIVDQLEEALTLCQDESEREAFFGQLGQVAGLPGDAPGTVTGLVVLGLRADFYGQATRYPLLRDVLRDAPVLLDPMSEAELRQAISFPARAVGLKVEPGLVEVLLRDLGVAQQDDRAGRLPLLAHALWATWQQRREGLLTVDGYRATGGIERAVATTADRAYDGLDATAQEEARVLFLRLVVIGEGGSDTRRRLSRAELLRDFDQPALSAVLDVFTQRRLLTQEQDTVTITHEALVYAWPRLREWIDSDRIGNVLRQDLDAAASSWEGEKRDPAVLYRGSRLAAARSWAAAHSRDLTATASAFLDASVRQENRAVRTRRVAAALLAALTLIASVTAGIALFLRHQAVVQRNEAIVSQITTEADQLQATNPSLAAQLDLVANRMQPGNTSIDTSLIDAENTALSAVLPSSAAVFSVAFSHDGRLLATNSEHGTIQLWNLADVSRPAKAGPALQGNDGVTRSLAFGSRGSILASATRSGVQLWSVADPAHPRLDGTADSGAGGAIAISPDGQVLAVTSGSTVGLWDIADPAHPVAFGPPLRAAGPALSVAFSHDGDLLAAGTSTDTIQLWNISHPARPVPLGHPIAAYSENVSTGAGQQINTLAFSPDRDMLADGDSNGVIQLWNLGDAARPVSVGQVLDSHDGGVLSIDFSADGDLLASGNFDDKIALWNVAKPAVSYVTGRLLSGHSATVAAIAFDPRGHLLASGSLDATARLWRLPPSTLVTWPAIDSVAFSRSGDLLAGGGADGSIRLWSVADAAHPRLLAGPLASQGQAIWSLAFSPDRHVLAAGSQDGSVRVWSVTNLADPMPLTKAFTVGPGPVRALAFARGSGVLLASSLSNGDSSGTGKGFVSVWDVTDPGHPLRAAPPLDAGTGGGFSMALSANGGTLAVQGLVSVALWDVSDPAHARLVGQTPAQLTGVHAVAFGPGGLLADAGFDNTIQLWNVGNPAHPVAVGVPITGPTGTIGSIAFSHDGKTLAGSGQDEVVRLWNVTDPARPVPIGNPLVSHVNTVWSLAWSPTGILASGSIDGSIRIWDLRLPAAITWICSATADNLTRAQWRRYIPELAYDPACPARAS